MGNNINHATPLQDTITLSSVSAPTCMIESIDLSSMGHNNITMGGPNMSAGAGSLPYNNLNAGFTIGAGWTGANTNASPWPLSLSQMAPRINLDGEGADIVVNGWSLVDAVKRIEQRLGLFQPNPQLETEWDQLKSLGNQYRELEQQILAKQATWDRLRAMPAPEID